MNTELIKKGFIIAGCTNIIGVLVNSKCFTNATIPEVDPDAMSNFGLLMIVIWGLAYIAVANNFQNVKWLVGVFAIEKFIYGFHWTHWILNNNLQDVYEKDTFAGVFYAIYGINDWVFFIFFSVVFMRLLFSNK